MLTDWARADAIAAVVVAALMVKGGWGLLRDSWRIFLEAAPAGVDVERVDADLHAVEGVVEVHDLHIWEVTSGFPAMSAHILVASEWDCHERRERIADLAGAVRHRPQHAAARPSHDRAGDRPRQPPRAAGERAAPGSRPV